MIKKTVSVTFPALILKTKPVVYSLKLKQDRYKHDVGKVTFKNWDLSEKIIPPGTPILITLRSIKGEKSYPGFVHHVKKVMETEKRFIEVTFIGASHRMKQKRKKVWKKVTVSQVAKRIAKSYKFAFDITNHPRVFSQLSQHGESDWEFLVKCAKKIGYYFRVDGTVLILKPIDEFFNRYKNHASSYYLSSAALTPNNIKGSDLYSFTPIVGESIPFSDATKSAKSFDGINPYTKKINSYTSQKNTKGKRINKKPPIFDSFDVDTVVPGNDIAKSHAFAFDELVKFPYRATGVVIGSPRLIPGMPIYLTGIGTDYTGYWILLSVEHVVHYISLTETKYSTVIEVGIDSLGPTSLSNINIGFNELPERENIVYVEPNTRQNLSSPISLLNVKSIPVQNEVVNTFGSINNRQRTSKFRNELIATWENNLGDIRIKQDKSSNRSVYSAQKIKRSKCC